MEDIKSEVTATPDAIKKIQEIIADSGDNLKLRIYVQGGGCSGFTYGFTLCDEPGDDDLEIDLGDTTIRVDYVSLGYLRGAVVDFVENLSHTGFTIVNPNATSTCGCGSSFSID